MSLNPKKVLVTGGSQGLGLALATLLASRGAHVVICSRSEAKLELALRKIKTSRQQEKQHLSYVVADVSTFAAASAALKDCPISIDTVFCCAGAATPGYFLDQTEAEFDKGISLIYKTALSTAHVCMLTLTHISGCGTIHETESDARQNHLHWKCFELDGDGRIHSIFPNEVRYSR